MNTVKTRQQQLLSAIFDCRINGQFDERGLSVYRANLRATAAHALRITFPTVHQLIGDDLFQTVTERLLAKQPPQMGDWACWGSKLPEVISELAALKSYPFIPDCAELDYICHQLVRHSDTTTKIETLSLLQERTPERLRIRLNPSLSIIHSRYPIAKIRTAHQAAETDKAKALKRVVELMNDQQNFHVACYRDGYGVRVETISAAEFRWLGFLKIHTLEEALNNIEKSDFDFKEWLLNSVQSNLLYEVTAE